MHFSEIIKLQLKEKKNRHSLLCILRLFRIIVAKLSLKKKKNVWLPKFYFWIP